MKLPSLDSLRQMLKKACKTKPLQSLRDEVEGLGRLVIGGLASCIYVGGEVGAEHLAHTFGSEGAPPAVQLGILLWTILGLLVVVGWLLRTAAWTLEGVGELADSFEHRFGSPDEGGDKGDGGPEAPVPVVPGPVLTVVRDHEAIDDDEVTGKNAEIMVTALVAAAIVIMWMNGTGGPTGGAR